MVRSDGKTEIMVAIHNVHRIRINKTEAVRDDFNLIGYGFEHGFNAMVSCDAIY